MIAPSLPVHSSSPRHADDRKPSPAPPPRGGCDAQPAPPGRRRILRAAWPVLLLLPPLLLTACAARRKAAEAAAAPPAPYMRVATQSNGVVELQIALRKFAPQRGKGPAVWLAAVSHLGDTNYYRLLQQHLDARTLVLYEGVRSGPNEEAFRRQTSATPEEPPAADAGPPSLQASVAASLGLAFQLEQIDYNRPNFRNSDLTVDELRALFAPPAGDVQPSAAGEAGAGEAASGTDGQQAFDGLMEMMDGSSLASVIMQFAVRIMGSSPKLKALTKLAIAELFGAIKGDIARMQGLPPDMQQLIGVLIHKRNERVVEDLRAALPRLKSRDSVSIFYGAGHMHDLEEQLRRELRYAVVADEWLPAIHVDLEAVGVSPAEIGMIRSVVRWQLRQMEGGAPSSTPP